MQFTWAETVSALMKNEDFRHGGMNSIRDKIFRGGSIAAIHRLWYGALTRSARTGGDIIVCITLSCIHTYAHILSSLPLCIHIYIHAYHTHIATLFFLYSYIYTCIHTYIHSLSSLYAPLCTLPSTLMYILLPLFTCTYTHTHIYTCIHTCTCIVCALMLSKR
jgi:hypothetical protein